MQQNVLFLVTFLSTTAYIRQEKHDHCLSRRAIYRYKECLLKTLETDDFFTEIDVSVDVLQ